MAVTSTEHISSGMEYAQHEKTYGGFVHLLKWFVVHVAIDLVALYFMIVQSNSAVGLTLLLIATAAMAYGIFTTPAARRKAEARSIRQQS